MAINIVDDLSVVKGIIFDLDNTLIDTRGGDRKALRKVKQYLWDHHGIPEELGQQIAATFRQCLYENPEDPVKGRADLDTWRTLLWSLALGSDRACLAEKVFPVWKAYRYNYLTLPAEICSMLTELRSRQYRIALISNGPSKAQWEKIRKIKAYDYFDVILVGGDFAEQKPHKSIFEHASVMMGVELPKCIMVGDTLATDIQGGVDSGVAATVWIPKPTDDRDDPKPVPDFTVTSTSDLVDLLLNVASL